MKFYNRKKEIDLLQTIESASAETAQMTVMIGRRRIGKTTLLKKAFHATPFLYFFVARKSEVLLCEEFSREVSEKLGLPLGSFTSFPELFSAIMQLSRQINFTLVIDEFQDFQQVNPSVFSDMQHIWDSEKDNSKINLVLCGSIYAIMKRIFEHSKEPLFGRATSRMTVSPFDTITIREILKDYHPAYTPEDLLAFYMITGGVARYIEQLVQKKAFTKKKILDAVLSEGSYFLDEGRNVLIDEFGKDYGNYFSILSLIASSKTERGQIESLLQMDVGGYLDRLEKEFGIIRRFRPFGAKENSRSVKYRLEDCFLNFWFRFIYKYRSAVEIGNLSYLREIVDRDYHTYSGLVLERFFRATLVESEEFSDIQSYWDKKGESEIDIVAVNDFERRLEFYEVKRNPARINLSILERKAEDLVARYPEYRIGYNGLSLADMKAD